MNDHSRGLVGVILGTVPPYIEMLTPVIQFLSMVLGVVLILVSIWHKVKQINQIKKK